MSAIDSDIRTRIGQSPDSDFQGIAQEPEGAVSGGPTPTRALEMGVSLWAGTLAAALGQGFWLELFFAGVLGFSFLGAKWRPTEQTFNHGLERPRDMLVILPLSAAVGGLYVGAWLALTRGGAVWAPPVAGALITAILLAAFRLARSRG